MDKDGLPFVFIPLIIAALAAWFQIWIIAGVFLVLASFSLFFFRDPKRVTPEGDHLIVSAADGRVTRIEDKPDGKLVSVFLSPFDVHINRAPIRGTVTGVELFKGLKKPATSDSASSTNERNAVTIERDGIKVVCTQIVGIVARRIVCRVKPGADLDSGQKFGLIRFGSRTDLLMPPDVEVLVKPGDRVVGGETIIAELPS